VAPASLGCLLNLDRLNEGGYFEFAEGINPKALSLDVSGFLLLTNRQGHQLPEVSEFQEAGYCGDGSNQFEILQVAEFVERTRHFR